MPTKAQLKVANKPIKVKIKTGDKVLIIAGKNKGEIGFVAAVAPRERKAIILQENPEDANQPLPLNAAIKHRKAKQPDVDRPEDEPPDPSGSPTRRRQARSIRQEERRNPPVNLLG
jgi:hypothetical protein